MAINIGGNAGACGKFGVAQDGAPQAMALEEKCKPIKSAKNKG